MLNDSLRERRSASSVWSSIVLLQHENFSLRNIGEPCREKQLTAEKGLVKLKRKRYPPNWTVNNTLFKAGDLRLKGHKHNLTALAGYNIQACIYSRNEFHSKYIG